jgi:transcription elongation factor Elf1
MSQPAKLPIYTKQRETTVQVDTRLALRWFDCLNCTKQFSVLENPDLFIMAECPACSSFITVESDEGR